MATRKSKLKQTQIEDAALRAAREAVTVRVCEATFELAAVLEEISRRVAKGAQVFVKLTDFAAELAGELRSRGFRAAHVGGGWLVVGW